MDQLTRDHAAAAMQLFAEDGGCDNEEAARRVARRLNRIGYSHLFTDRTEPYEQVKTWRETAMGHAGGGAGDYYQYLVGAGKATGLSPEPAAKHLLELLPQKSV